MSLRKIIAFHTKAMYFSSNLTKRMTFKIVLFLVLMSYHTVISKRDKNTVVSSGIIRSSNIVSNNVYKILEKSNGENILYCPVSFNIILSLISTAASGKTAKELKTALHLNIGNEDIKFGYQTLLKDIHDKKLHLATRIFPQTGVELLPEFATTAQKYFYSDVQAVDYNNNQKAAKIINTFVEKKTNNKIHEIIDPNKLDGTTKLILVNAAHFKDRWLHPFKETFTGDFHLSTDKKVKTHMMRNTKYYNYKELNYLNAKVLKINFETSPYSFGIILPNEIDGLHELETKLSSNNIDEIMNNMVETYVNLTIPKFKIEANVDLKSVLMKLGIKTLFRPDATLEGLVRNYNLYVSDILQKSYINVDQNGVEAAAVTAVTMHHNSYRQITEIPKKFTADHPFVFTIMRRNVIIFQGKLSKI